MSINIEEWQTEGCTEDAKKFYFNADTHAIRKRMWNHFRPIVAQGMSAIKNFLIPYYESNGFVTNNLTYDYDKEVMKRQKNWNVFKYEYPNKALSVLIHENYGTLFVYVLFDKKQDFENSNAWADKYKNGMSDDDFDDFKISMGHDSMKWGSKTMYKQIVDDKTGYLFQSNIPTEEEFVKSTNFTGYTEFLVFKMEIENSSDFYNEHKREAESNDMKYVLDYILNNIIESHSIAYYSDGYDYKNIPFSKYIRIDTSINTHFSEYGVLKNDWEHLLWELTVDLSYTDETKD